MVYLNLGPKLSCSGDDSYLAKSFGIAPADRISCQLSFGETLTVSPLTKSAFFVTNSLTVLFQASDSIAEMIPTEIDFFLIY